MVHADRDERQHAVVEQHSKVFRDMVLGFVRVHVLHHATIEPIYGSGIKAELAEHGYRMSWGTLYPLLHTMSNEGFLARDDRLVGGKIRKYYSITPLGRRALDDARRKVWQLVEEIGADDSVDNPVGNVSLYDASRPVVPSKMNHLSRTTKQ